MLGGIWFLAYPIAEKLRSKKINFVGCLTCDLLNFLTFLNDKPYWTPPESRNGRMVIFSRHTSNFRPIQADPTCAYLKNWPKPHQIAWKISHFQPSMYCFQKIYSSIYIDTCAEWVPWMRFMHSSWSRAPIGALPVLANASFCPFNSCAPQPGQTYWNQLFKATFCDK